MSATGVWRSGWTTSGGRFVTITGAARKRMWSVATLVIIVGWLIATRITVQGQGKFGCSV